MSQTRACIRMKWLQVIVHVTLVWGYVSSTTVCNEDRSQCYTLVTDKADQETAISRCRNHGSDLASLQNSTVVSDENDDTLAWINLNRFKSGGQSKFVNGSLLVVTTGSDDGCFALDNGEAQLYECYTSRPFVCSSKYIHDCSRQSDGNCYVYVPSQMSWYRARQYCRERYGGDLAVLLSSKDWGDNLTPPSWIGAYSELWKWNNTVEMNYSHWQEYEPNPDWSCAVVNIKTGLWETANCSTSYSYLCEGSHQDVPTTVIAGGVIGILLVLAGLIAAGFIIWKRRSRQNSSEMESTGNNSIAIETNPLGSRDTNQEIDGGALTVVHTYANCTHSLESTITLHEPQRVDAYEEIDIGPGPDASASPLQSDPSSLSLKSDDYDETTFNSKGQVVLRPAAFQCTFDIEHTGTKASLKLFWCRE